MPMAQNMFTNWKRFRYPNKKIFTCLQLLLKCRTYRRSLGGLSLPILIVVHIVILVLILVAILMVALLVVFVFVYFEAHVKALIIAIMVILVVILIAILVVVLVVVLIVAVDEEKIQKIPSNNRHAKKDLMRMMHNM